MLAGRPSCICGDMGTARKCFSNQARHRRPCGGTRPKQASAGGHASHRACCPAGRCVGTEGNTAGCLCWRSQVNSPGAPIPLLHCVNLRRRHRCQSRLPKTGKSVLQLMLGTATSPEEKKFYMQPLCLSCVQQAMMTSPKEQAVSPWCGCFLRYKSVT